MDFLTATGLKEDSLNLAGEPSDGSSPFDADVFGLLTVVQNTLVSGGQLGRSSLQPVDWPWARMYPRATLQLQQPVNGDYTNTATFTQGSRTVTLATSLGASDLEHWRLAVESSASRLYIDESAGTVVTLVDPWPDATTTTARWLAFQAEYVIPSNQVRFASPIFVSGWPFRIDVVDPAQLESQYPFSLIGPSIPVLAALVTERRLRFSHYLGTTAQGAPANTPLQLEWEAIERPDPIEDDTDLIVPQEHRRVLSYGAACLMAGDKADSDQARLYDLFQAQYKAMLDEFRRNQRNASSRHGVVIPRVIDEPNRLRTASGWPVW